VLKEGGSALVIDLRKDCTRRALNDYVRGRGLLNAIIIKLTFATMLKKRAYSREAIIGLVSQSLFGRGEVRLDPIGFELWLRK
jgi:hypothetical protein